MRQEERPPERRDVEAQVDRRRAEARVPEESPDRDDRGAALEEMQRAGVPQAMRAEIGREAGQVDERLEGLRAPEIREPRSRDRHEERGARHPEA